MGRGHAGQGSEDEFVICFRDELDRLLKQVKYGSITLVVQDGRVVQIDVTHKLRLDRPSKGGAPESVPGP